MEKYNTRISSNNMEHILTGDKTPAEIVKFLQDGALFRSFAEVLHAAYPGNDMAERLRENLSRDSNIKESSLNRSIQNWMEGKNTPKNREQIFKICFALGLTEEKANKVMASASDTGIHYRNPRELVYTYALRKKLSYGDACLLNQEMEKIYGPIVKEVEKERKEQWKSKEKKFKEQRRAALNDLPNNYTLHDLYVATFQDEEEPSFFTQRVKNIFDEIQDEEGLKDFFREHGRDLGMIHESAYEKFWKLLVNLTKPEVPYKDESRDYNYSIEKVSEVYFRMNVPETRATRDFSCLQKAIKKNWPEASKLQKMKTREIDVSRKAILLLFLITEDFMYTEEPKKEEDNLAFFDMVNENPTDELETMISRIDQFLEMYGMNQLDPGTPFDCLLIYALASQYEQDFISDNFSKALEILFQDVNDV